VSRGTYPEIIGAEAITIEVQYGDVPLPLAKMATLLLKPRRVLSTYDDLRDELDQLAKVLQQAPISQSTSKPSNG
jgi:hypothetical protein